MTNVVSLRNSKYRYIHTDKDTYAYKYIQNLAKIDSKTKILSTCELKKLFLQKRYEIGHEIHGKSNNFFEIFFEKGLKMGLSFSPHATHLLSLLKNIVNHIIVIQGPDK